MVAGDIALMESNEIYTNYSNIYNKVDNLRLIRQYYLTQQFDLYFYTKLLSVSVECRTSHDNEQCRKINILTVIKMCNHLIFQF